MNYVSVCKNVIQANNKRRWENPEPAIRVSRTPSGRVTQRAHRLAIVDHEGRTVARVISTTDGRPVTKAGAKVVIITDYETEVLE